ncbi:MAG: SDR family oxidoreductase, partial [Anoxybacillus ayderensis]|nr:SDR family oxidoreductase [Anoxybacillus ayderensis]
ENTLQQIADTFHHTYGVNVTVIVKDLTVPNAAYDIYEEVRTSGLAVDILVNNAGFGLFGEFVETDLQEEVDMIQVNITALTQLTKLFLRDMVRRKQGRVMNVASMAAFQPGPLMAVYYATKAYVLSFSEALSNELRHTNVTVSALCPGPTATGFVDRANLQQSKLFKSGVMDVKQVVEAGYKGVMNNKTVIIPGVANKLLAFSVRFMPRKFVTNIVRKVQDRV